VLQPVDQAVDDEFVERSGEVGELEDEEMASGIDFNRPRAVDIGHGERVPDRSPDLDCVLEEGAVLRIEILEIADPAQPAAVVRAVAEAVGRLGTAALTTWRRTEVVGEAGRDRIIARKRGDANAQRDLHLLEVSMADGQEAMRLRKVPGHIFLLGGECKPFRDGH
jgi:hypothetical protein